MYLDIDFDGKIGSYQIRTNKPPQGKRIRHKALKNTAFDVKVRLKKDIVNPGVEAGQVGFLKFSQNNKGNFMILYCDIWHHGCRATVSVELGFQGKVTPSQVFEVLEYKPELETFINLYF